DGIAGEVVSSCRHLYRKSLPLFVLVSAAILPAVVFFARDFGHYSLLIALWVMFAIRAGLGIFSNGKFHILTGAGWYHAGKTAQVVAELGGLPILFLALRAGLGVVAIAITAVVEGVVLWYTSTWFLRRRIPTMVAKPPDQQIVKRLQASALALLGNTIGVFL